MRDFLYSEISQIEGVPNIPDDPDLAIKAGTKLCEELLEPLNATFGRIGIRSACRAVAVNEIGAANGNQYNCSTNQASYANHIWDRLDANGHMGAMATIVIPWFIDRYDPRTDWRRLAWWIHDHLPYSDMCFFPNLAAFNLGWHEERQRRIYSCVAPKGLLTKVGYTNQNADHAEWYPGFPTLIHP